MRSLWTMMIAAIGVVAFLTSFPLSAFAASYDVVQMNYSSSSNEWYSGSAPDNGPWAAFQVYQHPANLSSTGYTYTTISAFNNTPYDENATWISCYLPSAVHYESFTGLGYPDNPPSTVGIVYNDQTI